MSANILVCLAITAVFLSNVNAQMLIPLYGACTSSVQCVGVAICFNHVCQCPPVYNAVGITCVYAGLEGELMAPPAPIAPPGPVPFPAPPLPGPLPGPPPPGPPFPVPAGAPFAYPGLPCAAGKTCIGNSVCVQGTCGCPAGQVVAGYSCVAPQRVLAGGPVPVPGPGPAPYAPVPRPVGGPYFPPSPYGPVDRLPGDDELEFLFGARGAPPPGIYPPGAPYPGPPPSTCPPAQVPLGPECFPPAAIVNYPAPVPCQPAAPAPCMGGASCVGAVCACPAPFVWAGSACVPPPPPQPALPLSAPPPPPPPYPALAVAPFAPAHFIPAPYAPMPVARPAAAVVAPPPYPVPGPGPVAGPLALGSACSAHSQCVVGAFCQLGVCQCRPAFLPYGSICVLRRRAKDEIERSNSEKKKRN